MKIIGYLDKIITLAAGATLLLAASSIEKIRFIALAMLQQSHGEHGHMGVDEQLESEVADHRQNSLPH